MHLLVYKVFYCNSLSSSVTTQGDFWGTFFWVEEFSYEVGITVCVKKCVVDITDLTHEKFYENKFLGRNVLSGPPEH